MMVSCAISSTTNTQKRTEIAGLTTMDLNMIQRGSFEDCAGFSWELMELFDNRTCLCVSITVCDKPYYEFHNFTKFVGTLTRCSYPMCTKVQCKGI